MDKLGYRKITRHSPSRGQWLKEKGQVDADNELYYLRNIGPNAMYRRLNNNAAMRRFKKKEEELMKKAKLQKAQYQMAILGGEVQEIEEYIPLDLDNEKDAAYYRVQKKRIARQQNTTNDDENL